MYNELVYLIYGTLRLKGYGVANTNKLLSMLSGNRDVSSDRESVAIKLKAFLEKELLKQQLGEDIALKKILVTAKNKNVSFLTVLDSGYPVFLKQSLKNNTPPIISLIGNQTLLNNNKVGFCGSRKASQKGLDVAKDCATQLSELNVAVVSGYASGVDLQTHYWALKSGGSTIIVLPEGINKFYVKKELKDVWDWNRVLVISEFEPNDIWSTGRAMQRNNTIIALSNAMILIEAGEKGGSIDAGNKTLKLNKFLFAPIYEGMPPYAIGNGLLLNKGAYPIMKSARTSQANLTQVFKAVQVSG